MIGAFKLNSIGKFTVTAVAEVIRSKKGITAVGNAQIDTAQSKFGGASALFDGSGDYLVSPAQFSLGTDDWTVECWIRVPSLAAKVVWETRAGDNDAGTTSVQADGTLGYYDPITNVQTTTSTYTANTWFHACWERSGSTLRIYINGVVGKTATISGNLGTNRPLTIGATWSGGASLNGHIDEFRVSNTARYTGNFTPATQPFQNDANTLLLLHMDGTDGSTYFEDDNGVRSQQGITAVDNAQISTAQSKFGGASYYGNGASNYLLADIINKSSVTNFTFECWLRIASTANAAVMLMQGYPLAGQRQFYVVLTGAEANRIYLASNNGYQFVSWTPSLNVWYHIALTINSSGEAKIYVDGTQIGSTFTGVTMSSVIGTDPQTAFGRYQQSNLSALNGFMDEIRISNTARYTANFTAPTQPFVNDANTLLLIHCDGSPTPFNDDNGTIRIKRLAIPRGNAEISTTQSRFGGSSIIFDGSTAHIDVVPASDFNFGTGNFTVEAWIYVNNVNTIRAIWGNGLAGFYIQTNRSLNFFNSATGQVAGISNAIPLNTWTHVALSRSSGTLRGFINGTQAFSTTTSVNMTGITAVSFGGLASNDRFLGHMDEMRISSNARYTANFTAPTAAFTNDANTLLLIHGDLPNPEQISFKDDNGVRAPKGIVAFGDARISTAQSKFGGASALFDGNGDYLNLTNDPAYTFAGDFTVECWYRLPGAVPGIVPFFFNDHLFYLTNDGGVAKYAIFSAGSNRLLTGSVGTVSSGVWYHVAFVRSGSTLAAYHNGVSAGTSTWSNTMTSQANNYIGFYPGSTFINAHIDEYRISNTARYTANFTAPSAPFQNDDNTLLLLHMDGTDGSTVFFDDNGRTPTP
jgi:hypothetical protein